MEFAIIITTHLVSVYLHEVGHSFMANRLSGGYNALVLNPIKFVDKFNTILFPLAYLLLYRSPPFVGGSVYYQNCSLNPLFGSKALSRSLVSFSGPAMNIIFAGVLIVVYKANIIPNILGININNLIALTVYYQIAIAIFNILPFPGTDGFHILSHFLPYSFVNFVNKYHTILFIIIVYLFVEFTFTRDLFYNSVYDITDYVGILRAHIAQGSAAFYKIWGSWIGDFKLI